MSDHEKPTNMRRLTHRATQEASLAKPNNDHSALLPPCSEADKALPSPMRRNPEPEEEAQTTSGKVASLLDDCFRIPGTNIRFGLDPILGLFPGLGDTVASVIGVAIIGEGSRRGVSRMALATMAMNILLNTAIGSIPIVGDAFSIWFKSNRRNHDLLRKATSTAMPTAEREKAIRRARGFTILLIAGVIIGVILIVALALSILRIAYQAISV